jgi:hypothetical protein
LSIFSGSAVLSPLHRQLTPRKRITLIMPNYRQFPHLFVSPRWVARTTALITLLFILPAQAQGFGDRRSLPKDLNPISRQGFAWINELSGGIDANGYYKNPVSVQSAFGIDLPNGWHRAPMAWDDQGNALLFYVENGYIIRQDFAPFQ